MKQVLTAWVLGLLLLVAPQGAMAQSGAENYVTGLTYNDVGAVIQGIGHEPSVITDANGAQIVRGKTPEGLVYLAKLWACGTELDPNCVGLELVALFEMGDQGVDLDALNGFASANPFLKTFATGNFAATSRYVITDYGVSKGNVVSNFRNFIGNTFSFVRSQAGGAQASLHVVPNGAPGIERASLGADAGTDAAQIPDFWTGYLEYANNPLAPLSTPQAE